MRKNQYEEALFRVEDDRFELDMAIETNASALRAMQRLVAELEELQDRPAERERWAPAPGALTAIHYRAANRIYGDHGPQVPHHLRWPVPGLHADVEPFPATVLFILLCMMRVTTVCICARSWFGNHAEFHGRRPPAVACGSAAALSTFRMVADCGASEEKSAGRRSSGVWAPAAEGRRMVGILS